MRKVGVALCALLLAGCASSQPDYGNVQPTQSGDRVSIMFGNGYTGELQVVTIEVNGRNVECVVMSGYREGGVSCDFAHAGGE